MNKILFICNSDWFFISHRLPIAIEAKANGYEIHVATTFTDENLYRQLKQIGFTLHPITLDRSSLNLFNLIYSFLQILKLNYQIKPNILHVITIKPVILGGISSLFFPRTNLVAAIPGLGYVYTLRTLKGNFLKRCVQLLYKIALIKKRKIVIFQNKQDMSNISRLCNLNNRNIVLIPGSGVDLKRYKPSKDLDKTPIILFAARLLKSKGIYEFVEAAKSFKGIRFVVVGKFDIDNPDCISEKEIRSWVDSGIIEYWGFHSDMPQILSKASIVAYPSFYAEGLPKILIEAAACGIPIVTTDHPGCRDAIKNGITGFLVPVRDSEAIVKAIKKILASDKLAQEMSKSARTYAENNFDINTVIQTHLKIYAELNAYR